MKVVFRDRSTDPSAERCLTCVGRSGPAGCRASPPPFEDVTIPGAGAMTDMLSEIVAASAELMGEAADESCTLYDPPRYDPASETYSSARHDVLDATRYSTAAQPVRFSTDRPELRPCEV